LSLPYLTVRLTLPLCFRWLPGFGCCETTRPGFALLEEACLIFPAEQKCALSARLAADRVLPLTFGTTHFLNVNLAVTDVGAFTVILQRGLPLQAPDQPAKVDPLAAFAFRVTDVPHLTLCEHVFGQLMPAGELLIFPEPFPDL
jgi:hypothetical protein